jgi:lysophospholipase L1-like esterase
MKSLILTTWILLFPFSSFSQQVTIEGELSMLALGDSYTIGESTEVNERWPHQLIKELKRLGVSAEFPDYIATTGWTTRNLLDEIQTKLPEDKEYNLVSILIGVNNQYQRMDIGIYEPELRSIIDIALEVVDQDKSKVMILSIPDYAYTPFGNGNSTISEEIDAYNAIKKRVAAEYGIAYIYITDISRMGLNNPSLVAADGLHPSKEQYALWVQTIILRLNLPQSLSAKERIQNNEPIKLYPNPAGSHLFIDTVLDIDRIHIYNPMGQMLMDVGVDSLPARIDISRLESGAYTLCARHGDSKGSRCRPLLIIL